MIYVIQLIHSLKLQQCKADEDTVYELEAAKKNIIDCLKHLIRDAQQKKAKEYAFANLKENTAFWLRDFCQKVLPVKFWESQQDYYGKKGISLHADVFLMKQQNLFKKHVYFTVIQRCEQGVYKWYLDDPCRCCIGSILWGFFISQWGIY